MSNSVRPPVELSCITTWQQWYNLQAEKIDYFRHQGTAYGHVNACSLSWGGGGLGHTAEVLRKAEVK